MMQELLRSKFGDCKFIDASLCNNKSSYESTRKSDFYIYDPPSETNQPIRIVSSTDDYQLIVDNKDGKEICIVKTDKCLFDKNISKCDCILFNNNKFYLIEIKDSKKSQRHTSRKRAVEQLGTTIDTLIENQIDLTDFAPKAIICFKSLSPYPIRASLLSERAEFFEKYKVSLDEGNKIEF